MNKEIWDKWNEEWNWILQLARRKKWKYSEIEIVPPISLDRVRAIESKYNFKMPEDLIKVVTEFASAVKFFWEMPEERNSDEFGYIIRSNDSLWEINEKSVSSPGRFGLNESNCGNCGKHYIKIWQKKGILLADDGAGNYAALDLSYENAETPVINLDHNGLCNGLRFGTDFIDFVSRISRIGNVSYNIWVNFYNSKSNLLDDGIKAEAFRQYLENDIIPEKFAGNKGLLKENPINDENIRFTYHWNGKIKEHGIEINGVKNGFWKEFDEWGTIMVEENYKSGLLHGTQKTYYPNGNIKFITKYEEDELIESEYYYMDGEKHIKFQS